MKVFRERDWDRLIAELIAGKVVPIVGSELSVFAGEQGQLQGLDEYLLAKLRAEYEEELTSLGTRTRRVASDIRRCPGLEPNECHFMAYKIMAGAPADPVGPLPVLARIRPLDLFVSASPDEYLPRALQAQRGAAPRRFVYSTLSTVEDLPPAIPSGETVVYQIFGNASPTPDFALNEEDLLQFVNRLQAPDHQPQLLFDRLRHSTLLFIGCSFPDWLARFFLLTTSGDRLLNEGVRAIFADQETPQSEDFTAFLDRCRARVWPDGDGAHFVQELHDRWQQAEKTQAPVTITSSGTVEKPADDGFAPQAIFISYASEDAAAAQAFAEALRGAGLPVWLDRQRLEAGDDYTARIFRHIRDASFFVPLLSRHTLVGGRRFFYREWNKALEEQSARPPGAVFIVPVAIDEAPSHEDDLIPERFDACHWTQCPGGIPSPEFLNLMKKRIRDLRRPSTEGGTANG